MAKKTRKIDGFIADIKEFQEKILPKQFVSFQKWIAIEVYKRIMQKTPVDEGILRGSWTVSIGSQDRSAANNKTNAKEFDSPYAGEQMTDLERGWFTAGIDQMSDITIGQIVWLNNAMPYVLVIEFDNHSKVKAPSGMVRLSIQEAKTYFQTIKTFTISDTKGK
jgi:hypothetical protein